MPKIIDLPRLQIFSWVGIIINDGRSGTDWDKFLAWDEMVELLLGNPLYHWTHLELKEYFGITALLTRDSDREIYEICNRMLAEKAYTTKMLLKQSDVCFIGTTDDLLSDLNYHKKIRETESFVVAPSFRWDPILNIQKGLLMLSVSQLQVVPLVFARCLRYLKDLFAAYEGFADDRLRENFKYFIDAILPICEAYDIKMAIHPDDPPFSIFGLPRLVNNEDNIKKLLAVNPSPYNGLTFCTGSLGSDPQNDVVDLLKRFGQRVHFMHVQNVRVDSNGDFSEVSHRSQEGTVDITRVMKVLSDSGFEGYIRPDHGRHVFGENATNVRPGYGLYDRAMGAMYLLGSWDMAQRL